MRGIEQLNDILDLIRNPDKYEEKAKALKSLVDQHRALVEAHVKVSQVDAFVAEAQRKNTEAEAKLAAAKEEAEKILATSREEANKLIEQATALKEKADAALNKASDLEKEANAKHASAALKEKEASEKLAALDAERLSLEKEAMELAEKRAKLLEAIK